MIANVRGTYPGPVRAPEDRVKQIFELVAAGAAYTIRDLAQQVRLSPSHTQRLFKQETGACLGEWLVEQRLRRAAHLLQHSYLSVKEITHTMEYEHASSFTRAFERRFGDSPTRYRKRWQGFIGLDLEGTRQGDPWPSVTGDSCRVVCAREDSREPIASSSVFVALPHTALTPITARVDRATSRTEECAGGAGGDEGRMGREDRDAA